MPWSDLAKAFFYFSKIGGLFFKKVFKGTILLDFIKCFFTIDG